MKSNRIVPVMALLAVLLATSAAALQPLRTWTSRSGKKVLARYAPEKNAEVGRDEIVLEGEDGRFVKIRVDLLSESDISWLEKSFFDQAKPLMFVGPEKTRLYGKWCNITFTPGEKSYGIVIGDKVTILTDKCKTDEFDAKDFTAFSEGEQVLRDRLDAAQKEYDGTLFQHENAKDRVAIDPYRHGQAEASQLEGQLKLIKAKTDGYMTTLERLKRDRALSSE